MGSGPLFDRHLTTKWHRAELSCSAKRVSCSTKPQWQKRPNLFSITTRNDPTPTVLEVFEQSQVFPPFIDDIKENHGHYSTHA
jgi:hypothetical protein